MFIQNVFNYLPIFFINDVDWRFAIKCGGLEFTIEGEIVYQIDKEFIGSTTLFCEVI